MPFADQPPYHVKLLAAVVNSKRMQPLTNREGALSLNMNQLPSYGALEPLLLNRSAQTAGVDPVCILLDSPL